MVGDAARELRELLGCAEERKDRDDDPAEFAPEPPRRMSFFSRPAGPDHSLSVAALLTESSRSPALLLPPPLVDAEPETALNVDELALMSFSFSLAFSMKIRDRASLYKASRCSNVRCFFALPGALLRPPWLPASEGSISDMSGSSPVTELVRDWGVLRIRSCGVRRMIWKAGCVVDSAGTRSEIRRMGTLLSGAAWR